jgi:hypothetical protein
MSDRSVVDTVDAFAVEPQDYVRFTDGTEVHEGAVLAVEDRGDTVTLVLSDDLEGDTIAYDVDALTQVEILGYVSLEVA